MSTWALLPFTPHYIQPSNHPTIHPTNDLVSFADLPPELVLLNIIELLQGAGNIDKHDPSSSDFLTNADVHDTKSGNDGGFLALFITFSRDTESRRSI